MRIVSGDIGGFRLSLESVTGGAHTALTAMPQDAREELVAQLSDTLTAMERHGYLPRDLPSPSAERRVLLALDTVNAPVGNEGT